MQLTVWHKGTDKPERDGVYERVYSTSNHFCLYKKGYWLSANKTVELAAKETIKSLTQELPWRGITKDEK